MNITLEKLENISNTGMAKLSITYQYVLLGIIASVIGAGIGIMTLPTIQGLAFLALIVLQFSALFLFLFKQNILTYLAFTFITGLTLTPLMSMLIGTGQVNVIFQALMGTAIVVGGLTYYTLTTKKDYLQYKTIFFWILVGIIIVSVVNIFLGSSLLSLVISWVVLAVFSYFIVADTQEVLYTDITPLAAAMSLYLDILNIFIALVNILSNKE